MPLKRYSLRVRPDGSSLRENLAGDLVLYEDVQALLERERTIVADSVVEIWKALRAHEWLRLGRGSYEYDDQRWMDEFGATFDAITEAIQPLEKKARDLTDCPTEWEKIKKAREKL